MLKLLNSSRLRQIVFKIVPVTFIFIYSKKEVKENVFENRYIS